MKRNLYPDEYLSGTYVIDFEKLRTAGYCGVIFDIDNTLVPHGFPADERAAALFEQLIVLGFRIVLLSNNKEPRVRLFLDGVRTTAEDGSRRVFYVYKAGKPKSAGYLRAMELMGTERADTLFVGDQIFTDIWGANRVGLHTILVKKIHPREEPQIVLKRFLEFFVLIGYRIYWKHRKQKESVR